MRHVYMAVALASAPVLASATTVRIVTYELSGSEFTDCSHYGSFAGTCATPPLLPIPNNNNGEIRIDESLLPGGTLSNQEIAFTINSPYIAAIHADLPYYDEDDDATFYLRTDANKAPEYWRIDSPWSCFGQESSVMTLCRGFSGQSYNIYSGPDGELSLKNVAPVPAPLPVLTLIGGIGALSLLRRRRAG